jgi:hypothetical protein
MKDAQNYYILKKPKQHWLQHTNEIYGDNLKNIKHEANRHFRNKKKEYLKDRINELAINSKNKNAKNAVKVKSIHR